MSSFTTDFRATEDGVAGFSPSKAMGGKSRDSSVFPSTFEGDIYSPEYILERLITQDEMKMLQRFITSKEDFYTSPGLLLLSALQAYDTNNDFKSQPPMLQHLIVKYFSMKNSNVK